MDRTAHHTITRSRARIRPGLHDAPAGHPELRLAVLRQRPGRDGECDVLVDPEERWILDAALARAGFIRIPQPPRSSPPTADRDRRFHARYDDSAHCWFVVESFTDLYFDPHGGHRNVYHVPGLARAVLSEAPSLDPAMSPRRWPKQDLAGPATALATILHETVNRNAARHEKLSRAFEAYSTSDGADTLARMLLGAEASGALFEAVRQGNGQLSAPDAAHLRRAMIAAVRTTSWRRPFSHLARSLATWTDRLWYRRLNRRTWNLVVLGPDGVGKTTVCHRIEKTEAPPRCRWTYVYNGRPKVTGPARILRRSVKLLYLVAERVAAGSAWHAWSDDERRALAEIRLRMTEGRVRRMVRSRQGPYLVDLVVSDRGVVDELVGLVDERAIRRAGRLVRTAISESFHVLLYDDPVVINARKDEYEPTEIADQMDALRRTLVRFRDELPSRELDVHGCDPDVVADRIHLLINSRLSAKT